MCGAVGDDSGGGFQRWVSLVVALVELWGSISLALSLWSLWSLGSLQAASYGLFLFRSVSVSVSVVVAVGF
jgi:hypothetical protein